jgi:hypothetical protein
MLKRVFNLEDEEENDDDIIFRIDFNRNNIQLNQQDLSQNRQAVIIEYQKLAQKMFDMGW